MSTCRECIHHDICEKKYNFIEKGDWYYDDIENECEYFKNCSKFIELPCKVGDYLEWDDGDGVSLYFEVLGFRFNMLGEISRFVTKNMQPIISHGSIKRILTKEEAEQALAERGVKDNG